MRKIECPSKNYFSGNVLNINICSQSIIILCHSIRQTVVMFHVHVSLPCSYLVDMIGYVCFWFWRAVILFKFPISCVARNPAGLRSLSMRFCVCSISGELSVPTRWFCLNWLCGCTLRIALSLSLSLSRGKVGRFCNFFLLSKFNLH